MDSKRVEKGQFEEEEQWGEEGEELKGGYRQERDRKKSCSGSG